MATNNADNYSNPLAISQGGTNATSMATTDGTAYYNGSSIVVTNTGTSGQLLTSNGSGNAPTWQTHSGGGSATGLGWDLIQSQTFPPGGSFALNFTTGIVPPYNNFMVVYSEGFVAEMAFRYSTNGGLSYISSGYLSTCQRPQIQNPGFPGPDFSNAAIIINAGTGAPSGTPYGSTAFLFDVTSGRPAYIVGLGTNNSIQNMFAGSFGNSAAINALSFGVTLGASSPARITLYGLNQ